MLQQHTSSVKSFIDFIHVLDSNAEGYFDGEEPSDHLTKWDLFDLGVDSDALSENGLFDGE